MSDFGSNPMLTSTSSQYMSMGSQYNAATTVAINLRQFEKDSKAQAEREYDDEHGPLPDPPADDDPTIPVQERVSQKKKRKVRSALVSRRKSAIYVEKLEAELETRDSDNASLAAQLDVCKDVLHKTAQRIEQLEQHMMHMSRREPPAKRLRTSLPRQPSPTDAAPFFLNSDDTLDDILSISPEEIPAVPFVYAKTERMERMPNDYSECSDGRISPKRPSTYAAGRVFSGASLRDDSGYRSRPPLATQYMHHNHFRTPVAL